MRPAYTPALSPKTSTPALKRFSALSRELGIWSVLGSVAVPSPDGRSYNRQYVFDDTGAVRATYEKIHLFDVNLSAGEQYKESATLSPGARAVTTDTPWGNMGLSICYDVRFPHLYRDLAKAGAEFLTCPAAFTHKTGSAHWHVLLPCACHRDRVLCVRDLPVSAITARHVPMAIH